MYKKILDIIEKSWVKKFYALFTTIISLIGIIYSIKEETPMWDKIYITSTYFFVFLSCVISAFIIYKSNKLTESKNQEINSLNNEIHDLENTINNKNKMILSMSERFKKLSKRNFSDLLSSEFMDSSKSEREILSKGKHYGIASIISHLNSSVTETTNTQSNHYERLYVLSSDLNIESEKFNKNLMDMQYYLFYTGEDSYDIDEQHINKLREVSSLSLQKQEIIRKLCAEYDESDSSLIVPLYSKYGDIYEIYGFLEISFDDIDKIENRELIKNIAIVVAYDLSYYLCRLLNNIRNRDLSNNSQDILNTVYQYISKSKEV